ncbi:MAG: Fic family protein [Oscillospiraceae bacterium]|nr:Fic family protein [Oscillospiraceae bacterium]
MAYRIDPICDNCYPGTAVLVNKFDIRNEEKLNEVESVITSARAAEWLNAPQIDTFDFSHYCAVHHFLFSDLYHWAGMVRTVNISKKRTVFTPADQIETQANAIFNGLKFRNFYKDLPFDHFVEEITDFYCMTNTLHPFREGNGRTQRVFLSQLVSNAGYSINFSHIDTDLLMLATIQSAQGVQDLLLEVLRAAIQEK